MSAGCFSMVSAAGLVPQSRFGDKYEMPADSPETVSMTPVDEAVQAVREAQESQPITCLGPFSCH